MPLPEQLEAQEERLMPKQCTRTGHFKPARSHFDSEVRRNVVGMDHHCPWVNNTIGVGNHKMFFLFLIYVQLGSLYAICLLIGRAFVCGLAHPRENAAPETLPPVWCDDKEVTSGTGHMLRALLLLESVLFGVFTCGMACEDWPALVKNETYIDR